MVYDAIVIGAGVGGLTCALKLISKGKSVLVIEKQPVPGGVATSFKRKGFTFEAILHFVNALGPSGEIRKFLDDFGISAKVDFIEMKEFGRVIYPEHDFVVGTDFNNLKVFLKDNFPKEGKGIDEFFHQAQHFYRQFDRFSSSKFPLWLTLMLTPFLYPEVIKTSYLTLEQFISKKIKDKKLRSIIGTIWGFIGLPPSEISAFYFLIVFRGYWGEKTAYVRGGFSRLFNVMVDKIKESGSQIQFNTCVKSIITDKGRVARAVVTERGEEFRAKAIISNANAIDTLTKLIDTDFIRNFYTKKFSSMRKSLSGLTVYLGLDVPAKVVGMNYPLFSINSIYDHDESFRRCAQGDYRVCNLALIDHSQLDPALAPAGKSTIVIMTLDSYANWQGLGTGEYKNKKKLVADTVIARLEKYFPGISSHIELVEVGTPRTMERFASLPEGAIYGFAETVAQSSINRLSQETKVKGLFLTGAWTRPGCGVHACFISGADAADLALGYLKNKQKP